MASPDALMFGELVKALLKKHDNLGDALAAGGMGAVEHIFKKDSKFASGGALKGKGPYIVGEKSSEHQWGAPITAGLMAPAKLKPKTHILEIAQIPYDVSWVQENHVSYAETMDGYPHMLPGPLEVTIDFKLDGGHAHLVGQKLTIHDPLYGNEIVAVVTETTMDVYAGAIVTHVTAKKLHDVPKMSDLMPDTQLIVDGSITSAKIAISSITATKIDLATPAPPEPEPFISGHAWLEGRASVKSTELVALDTDQIAAVLAALEEDEWEWDYKVFTWHRPAPPAPWATAFLGLDLAFGEAVKIAEDAAATMDAMIGAELKAILLEEVDTPEHDKPTPNVDLGVLKLFWAQDPIADKPAKLPGPSPPTK